MALTYIAANRSVRSGCHPLIGKAIATVALVLVPAFAGAAGRLLWEGGLWNLDNAEKRSAYGDFRLTIELDIWNQDNFVLRVEWLEIVDGKGKRVYAYRLIPELSTFIVSGKVKAEMHPGITSTIKLQNPKGRVLWLRSVLKGSGVKGVG